VGERDPPPTIGVGVDVGECGVECQCAQHPRLAEVIVAAIHRSQPRGQQTVIHLEQGSRRYAELHLIHAVLTDAEIGVRTEAERRGAGADVECAWGHDQAGRRQGVADRQVQAPLPALLRSQAAPEGHGVLGLGQDRPDCPAHQPMDRIAAVRLRERERVAPPCEGVPATADPVGPRHQQLTTPGRGSCVRRVPGQDVATAKGVGAHASPNLDHDSLVVAMSNGPLLTAGEDAHVRKIRPQLQLREVPG